MYLQRGCKHVALSDLSIIWKNIKNLFGMNKFRILWTIWDQEFELPGGSYSVSNIQDYVKYIIQKMKHLMIDHQSKYVKKIRKEHIQD